MLPCHAISYWGVDSAGISGRCLFPPLMSLGAKEHSVTNSWVLSDKQSCSFPVAKGDDLFFSPHRDLEVRAMQPVVFVPLPVLFLMSHICSQMTTLLFN